MVSDSMTRDEKEYSDNVAKKLHDHFRTICILDLYHFKNIDS